MFFLAKKPGMSAKVTWAGVAVCLAAYATLIRRFKLWGAIIATQLGFVAMAYLAGFFTPEERRIVSLAGRRMLQWAGVAERSRAA